MLSSLGKLSTESKQIQAQIRKIAQDKLTPSLKEAFGEVRAVVPALEAIRWTQYTPYFNDGDECSFSLHGVYFKLAGTSEDEGDYSDGFLGTWELKKSDLTKVQLEVLDSFENELRGVEDLLREALGDHAKVTVTADGIETEGYEHD